jgi:tetratricopeptide (TPR) repeat protein
MEFLDTNDATTYYNCGNTHYEKGEFDEAIKYYTEAIKKENNFASAYYMRAMAYSQKEDDDSRIEDLDKVIELSPDNVDAYLERADAFVCKEFYKPAKKDLEKVLEMDENNEMAIKYLAMINAAIEENCSTAAETSSKLSADVDALFNTGSFYFLECKFDEAIECFDKVIELSPSYEDAYYRRGKAFASKNYERMSQGGNYWEVLKDYDSVMNNFHKALENYSYGTIVLNAHLYYERGVVYASMGDCEEVNGNKEQAVKYYDEAIKEYNIAFNNAPNDKEKASLYTNRSIALVKKAKLEIKMGNLKYSELPVEIQDLIKQYQ